MEPPVVILSKSIQTDTFINTIDPITIQDLLNLILLLFFIWSINVYKYIWL